MSAGTNVLLCPQNRGPAPTLSYFFRSTWSAAAALGSSSPPPRPLPRPRVPSSSSLRACAAPVPRVPAPRPRRPPRPDACPRRPGSARSSSRPPPRRHPGLVATVPGSPAAPAPPRTSSSSRPCGHAPPRPRPVRAATPPRPRRRPGQGPLLIWIIVRSQSSVQWLDVSPPFKFKSDIYSFLQTKFWSFPKALNN